MTESPTLIVRAARWTRYALITAIAVVMALILTNPNRDEFSAYPKLISRAQAGAISAAPGYLCTTLSTSSSDRLYIVDTTKQVICAYNVNGDKLRLVSARKIDYDSDIPEGSLPIGNIKPIEGGNGVTRDEAKIYSEKIKDAIAKLKR